MNDLPTWTALARRAFALLRARFRAVAPECTDCGMPMERHTVYVNTPLGGNYAKEKQWGDDDGHCDECAVLRFEASRLKAEAGAREEIGRRQHDSTATLSATADMTFKYGGNGLYWDGVLADAMADVQKQADRHGLPGSFVRQRREALRDSMRRISHYGPSKPQ